MIKVILYGIDGTMGKVLLEAVEEHSEFQCVAGIAPRAKNIDSENVYTSLSEVVANADLLIDFSHPANLTDVVEYVKSTNIPTLIATTGYTDDELKIIEDLANVAPVLWSTNLSMGVNLIQMILSQFGELLSQGRDVELIEKHHNKKVDVPSGTALTLANTLNDSLETQRPIQYGRCEGGKRQDEIAIHAIRGGTIVGEHQVSFSGIDEIIELKHIAQSKRIFAEGALTVGEILMKKENGFYTTEGLLREAVGIK